MCHWVDRKQQRLSNIQYVGVTYDGELKSRLYLKLYLFYSNAPKQYKTS